MRHRAVVCVFVVILAAVVWVACDWCSCRGRRLEGDLALKPGPSPLFGPATSLI